MLFVWALLAFMVIDFAALGALNWLAAHRGDTQFLTRWRLQVGTAASLNMAVVAGWWVAGAAMGR